MTNESFALIAMSGIFIQVNERRRKLSSEHVMAGVKGVVSSVNADLAHKSVSNRWDEKVWGCDIKRCHNKTVQNKIGPE